MIGTHTEQPAPHGASLTFSIECTATASTKFGTVHDVTIQPDWTVTTPHDLDVERIGRAFGGYSSCAAFVDCVIPAYRHLLRVTLGIEALFRHQDGSWSNTPAAACRAYHRHDTLAEAIRHEVTPTHLAGKFGVESHRIAPVIESARTAWASGSDPSIVSGGEQGHLELWDAALHPDSAAHLAATLPPAVLPLPVAAFVDAERSGVDQEWLHGVVSIYPTSEFTAWAASQSHGHLRWPVEAIAALSDTGIDAGTAIHMLERDVSAERIVALAESARIHPVSAGRWLAAWEAAGCQPGPAHHRVLSQARLLHQVPWRWDVTYGHHELLAQTGVELDRTEVGVMIVLQPHIASIKAAVIKGIRTATAPDFHQFTTERSQ